MRDEFLNDNIDYIFNSTIDIIYSIHASENNILSSYFDFEIVQLNQGNVPVFDKADIHSKVICFTRPELSQVKAKFHIIGLNGDGPYWYVVNTSADNFFMGYIHNDYIK